MIKDLLTLNDIVSDKLFKIPDYQRGYSWGKRQLTDLIKDIDHIQDKSHKHYTGTIVITSNSLTNRYDVVDGQQRLTTLIILLKCLYSTNETKFKEIESKFLYRDGEYVLETNKETNFFFKESVIEDKKHLEIKIKSLANLKNAKAFFNEWLSKTNIPHEKLLQIITNQLGFICFSPQNTNEIGIMFEVINNRGKELSELEKIKNYFIYYATIHNNKKLKNQVNDIWGIILEFLNSAGITNNEAENRYLRNCYIVYYSSNKSKSWDVYDELKNRYRPESTEKIDEKIEEISSFIDFICQAAKHYAYFRDGSLFNQKYDGPNKPQIAEALSRLRCHPVNASILPLYLALMSRVYDSPNEVSQLLGKLEILNFRIYVIPNKRVARADSKQGDLFWWAHDFYWSEDWDSESDDDQYFTSFGNKEVHGNEFDWLNLEFDECIKTLCPETTFIESLTIDDGESIDYYHWNGIRYLLASYEEHLHLQKNESWDIEKILIKRKDAEDDKGNDYLSIEHIWASKNRADHFSSDIREKRRLGNFVLLGLKSNIQLKNDDIQNKVKYLIENNLYSMRQVVDLSDYLNQSITYVDSWRQKKTNRYFADIATSLIDKREIDLVNFALSRWKLPSESSTNFDTINSFSAWDEKRSSYFYLKDNE
ncbi:DUF262 domain-containing protein [Marinoscillum pacificum]|uniref:DUF262 domain-containing protein n=1 Tax=Marinoscillum pacificum TaxID=392723 RepID=UPI002157C7ED|nr:DUF262 domain-containing protein [Marinoscillum pacificum]